MAYNGQLIVGVEKHSIAHKLHIKKGDILVSINGKEISDIFDYDFLIEDTQISLKIRKASGKTKLFEFEKDEDAPLGLIFASSLMDDYRSCANKCIFCFIDQMPPGMRETLYFKDDDSRLSFLQGNYITLTNMKDADIERMITYHMEPINISVHATDPDLRCRMLKNKRAGDVLKYIDRLYEAGIKMNGQIVLCKGINDADNLRKTIGDLSAYAPVMESVSVVPVGLTRYREGLYPLSPFEKDDACDVIDIIEGFQKKIYAECGIHFVHASDEFYLLAQRDLPEEERYDGYLQLENGVGMMRLLMEEFAGEIKKRKEEGFKVPERNISLATGLLAAPFIESLAKEYMAEYGGNINIIPIANKFFGEQITVSGLLCGCDIIDQLKGRDLGDELLLPVNMLRAGEEYFLDDVTIKELEYTLKISVRIVQRSGNALFAAFAGEENTDFRRQIYEQADSGNSRKA